MMMTVTIVTSATISNHKRPKTLKTTFCKFLKEAQKWLRWNLQISQWWRASTPHQYWEIVCLNSTFPKISCSTKKGKSCSRGILKAVIQADLLAQSFRFQILKKKLMLIPNCLKNNSFTTMNNWGWKKASLPKMKNSMMIWMTRKYWSSAG